MRKGGAARLFSLVLNLGSDLAVAVPWSRKPRFACRRDGACEVRPSFVSMLRDPVQLALHKETSAIAAVPRDRANERNDILEKIVVGELNICSASYFTYCEI